MQKKQRRDAVERDFERMAHLAVRRRVVLHHEAAMLVTLQHDEHDPDRGRDEQQLRSKRKVGAT